ncbi:MAG: glycosyltransferase [Lachnospiraceae bacterium]|nr:glycosyltransferase [Lachnospiraceae bacterium]
MEGSSQQYIDLSVLMSVYKNDSVAHFEIALNSVLSQTMLAKEIVLVVDGPVPEEMQKTIQHYEAQEEVVNVYWLEKNVGLGNALNYGLKKCKFDLVARMDSDDVSCPTRFEKEYTCFQKDKELAIVGSYADEFQSNPEEIISIRKVPVTKEEIIKKGVIRNPFNHPSVMFRKNVIKAVGGYLDLYLFEDYYLWIRLIEKKYNCRNIPEVLLHLRVGNGMIARRGGWKYYKSNKYLQDYMLKHKMIPVRQYLFSVVVRWIVQVAMTEKMREWFYKRMLR